MKKINFVTRSRRLEISVKKDTLMTMATISLLENIPNPDQDQEIIHFSGILKDNGFRRSGLGMRGAGGGRTLWGYMFSRYDTDIDLESLIQQLQEFDQTHGDPAETQ